MRWLGTVVALLVLIASPALAGDRPSVEDKGAPVGYDSQPTVPIWEPAKSVLWDNGPFVTHPGGGGGGADLSALQSALGLTIYGFGHQFSVGNLVADDFTVAASECWGISSITFFAYQSGSSTVSPITGVYFQIYDGNPSSGGTVIFGDLTTNRMVSSAWTNCYRALDTSPTATNRPIFADVCEPGELLTLGPGHYWVVWTTNGSTAFSGPWAPPITLLGVTTTGDGLQYTSTGWAAAVDGSSGQGFPFIIEGDPGATATEAGTWSAVKALYR